MAWSQGVDRTNWPVVVSKISSRKKMDSSDNSRALSILYQQILAQEVDRGTASELIDEIYNEVMANVVELEQQIRKKRKDNDWSYL